ncbi:hypothetical protein N007_11935 [Alicyclobacillus acidoterrestris ATCC 49025]|nr:hypothetical protein N007_11935 [Alicyclobacillus acidoterrestris ATCC 49025]
MTPKEICLIALIGATIAIVEYWLYRKAGLK